MRLILDAKFGDDLFLNFQEKEKLEVKQTKSNLQKNIVFRRAVPQNTRFKSLSNPILENYECLSENKTAVSAKPQTT